MIHQVIKESEEEQQQHTLGCMVRCHQSLPHCTPLADLNCIGELSSTIGGSQARDVTHGFTKDEVYPYGILLSLSLSLWHPYGRMHNFCGPVSGCHKTYYSRQEECRVGGRKWTMNKASGLQSLYG